MLIKIRLARRAWLAMLVVVLIAGCSSRDPEVLRFGLASSPATLDPRFATDAASTRINRLIYQRLVDFDEHYRPIPALASWRRESPLRWRFTLMPGEHRFSDGTPLTARDVKATYDSVLDPATGSPHRGSLSMIKAVELIDPRSVRFVLSRPAPLLPGRLVVGILPAARIAHPDSISRRPIGSGPFTLEAWPRDDRLILRRRRDGQRFELLRVASPTVRVLKLLRGGIDMMQGDLPPELIGWMERRSELTVQRRKGSNFAYLGFNMADPLTGRVALRRAIAHAVDRAAIIRYVMGGAARPASAILPPEHWAGNPRLVAPAYDPELARRILRRAGLTGARRPRITYKTSSDPYRLRLASIIQAQLGRVGIDVTLKSYDWGTFYGDIKAGRFQMYSLAWVGVKLPDIFRYTLYSASVPPAGANRGRYSNPRADRLIDAAERTESTTEQAAIYRRLEALLLVDLPYVPLWYEDQVFVSNARVHGFRVAPDGRYDGLAGVAALAPLQRAPG